MLIPDDNMAREVLSSFAVSGELDRINNAQN